MSTIKINGSFRVGQLFEEFGTAGLSAKIKTIRTRNEVDGLAASGEIEHDGTLSQVAADAVINAHVPARSAREILHSAKVTALIGNWKTGTAEQKAIAGILELLRDEPSMLFD
jgi:hypothetical protein